MFLDIIIDLVPEVQYAVLPLAVPIALGVAGLVGKGINYLNADSDQKKAQKELDKLSKEEFEQFAATSELNNYAGRVNSGIINPQGISAEQKAGTQAGITSGINTTIYNAKGQSGGNLSKYLANAFTPQISGANTSLAIADANMKNQNRNLNIGREGQVAQQFQSISDRNIQNKLNRRMMMLQGYGNSVLQNKRFKNQAIEGAADDLIGLGGNLALGEMYGNKDATGGTKFFSNPTTSAARNLIYKPKFGASTYTAPQEDFTFDNTYGMGN